MRSGRLAAEGVLAARGENHVAAYARPSSLVAGPGIGRTKTLRAINRPARPLFIQGVRTGAGIKRYGASNRPMGRTIRGRHDAWPRGKYQRGVSALLVDCMTQARQPRLRQWLSWRASSGDFQPRTPKGAESPASRQALAVGNRTEILRLGPGELAHNPWHVFLLRGLANATGAARSARPRPDTCARWKSRPTILDMQRFAAATLAAATLPSTGLLGTRRICRPGRYRGSARNCPHDRTAQPPALGLRARPKGRWAWRRPWAPKSARLERLMKTYIAAIRSGEVPLDEAKMRLMPPSSSRPCCESIPATAHCYVQLASLYLEKGPQLRRRKTPLTGPHSHRRRSAGPRALGGNVSPRWENKFLAAQRNRPRSMAHPRRRPRSPKWAPANE